MTGKKKEYDVWSVAFNLEAHLLRLMETPKKIQWPLCVTGKKKECDVWNVAFNLGKPIYCVLVKFGHSLVYELSCDVSIDCSRCRTMSDTRTSFVHNLTSLSHTLCVWPGYKFLVLCILLKRISEEYTLMLLSIRTLSSTTVTFVIMITVWFDLCSY